ncbi:hypothetical protein ACFU6S_03995 [Streptomyces sp. NPDC057456]|uniref:hypothetical protein n=1 Tax=unclassified Streptomyces TaxID=2593676 RepID=UPI0036AEBB0A
MPHTVCVCSRARAWKGQLPSTPGLLKAVVAARRAPRRSPHDELLHRGGAYTELHSGQVA